MEERKREIIISTQFDNVIDRMLKTMGTTIPAEAFRAPFAALLHQVERGEGTLVAEVTSGCAQEQLLIAAIGTPICAMPRPEEMPALLQAFALAEVAYQVLPRTSALEIKCTLRRHALRDTGPEELMLGKGTPAIDLDLESWHEGAMTMSLRVMARFQLLPR